MLDNWEDWENEDFVIPILTEQNTEKITKILEERRLVEESDNALAKDLFSDKDFVYQHAKTVEYKNNIKPLQCTEKKAPTIKSVSNKILNEANQKKISQKIKAEKERKNRDKEIYGDNEYYEEYEEYEDKFY